MQTHTFVSFTQTQQKGGKTTVINVADIYKRGEKQLLLMLLIYVPSETVRKDPLHHCCNM